MPPKRASRPKRTDTSAYLVPYFQKARAFFPTKARIPEPIRLTNYAVLKGANRLANRQRADTYRRQTTTGFDTNVKVRRDTGREIRSVTNVPFLEYNDETNMVRWIANPEDLAYQYIFEMLNTQLAEYPTAQQGDDGAYIRRMQYRFDITNSSGETKSNQTSFFDYTTDYDTLKARMGDFIERLRAALDKYDEDDNVGIAFQLRTRNFPPSMLGYNANGALEAQRIMNNEWFCPDTPADINCLWNAYAIASLTCPKKIDGFLEKQGTKTVAWKDRCIYIKKKYIKSLPSSEHATSGALSVQAIADGEKRDIVVHGIDFSVKETFHSKHKTQPPGKPPVHLMLSRNHFIGMIPNALRPEKCVDMITLLGETRKVDGFFKSSVRAEPTIQETVVRLVEEQQEWNTRRVATDENGRSMARKPIQKCFEKPRTFVANTFSTYDFETALDRKLENGESSNFTPYAVGVNTPKNGYRSFWGADCADQMLEYMWSIREEEFQVVKDEYDNNITHTIYAHNGGAFDMYMILRVLMMQDVDKQTWRIHQDQVINDGRYLRVTLYDPNCKGIRIQFQDSMAYFPGMSLKKIAEEYQVPVQKLEFDHDKVTNDNWTDHREECEVYLEADVLSLYQVLQLHQKYVWDFSYSNKRIWLCPHRNIMSGCSICKKSNEQFKEPHEKGGIMMSQLITAASISKRSFYNKYYDNRRPDIYMPTEAEFAYIKPSYQGGRNEMFIAPGQSLYGKLYYKDFTSLYPFVACSPLPYGEPTFVQFNNERATRHNVPIGFVRCMVRSIDFKRKPIHCYKEEGKCYFSYFAEFIEMRIYSDEILLGIEEKMYEYILLDAITYPDKKPFLRSFMTDAFTEKQTQSELGNSGRASAAKIVANSGYGFWGMSIFNKEGGKIEHKEVCKLDKAFEEQRVVDVNRHGDYFVSKQINDLPCKDVNIGVASAITSLARMHLWSLIDTIESAGGEVYYCDTDSVITNLDTDKNEALRKRFNPSGTGKKLGELKDEIFDKLKSGKYCNVDDIGDVGNWMDGMCVGALKCYAMRKNHPLMTQPLEITTQKGGNRNCKSSEYFEPTTITIDKDTKNERQVVGTKIIKNRFVRGGLTALLDDTEDVFQIRFEKNIPKNIAFQYSKAKTSADGLRLIPFVWTSEQGFH
jgi:hypothetical protein